MEKLVKKAGAPSALLSCAAKLGIPYGGEKKVGRDKKVIHS